MPHPQDALALVFLFEAAHARMEQIAEPQHADERRGSLRSTTGMRVTPVSAIRYTTARSAISSSLAATASRMRFTRPGSRSANSLAS